MSHRGNGPVRRPIPSPRRRGTRRTRSSFCREEPRRRRGGEDDGSRSRRRGVNAEGGALWFHFGRVGTRAYARADDRACGSRHRPHGDGVR